MNTLSNFISWTVKLLKKIWASITSKFFWEVFSYIVTVWILAMIFVIVPVNIFVDCIEKIENQNEQIEQLQQEVDSLKEDEKNDARIIEVDTDIIQGFELVLQDYGDFIAASNKGETLRKDIAGDMIIADKATVYKDIAIRNTIIDITSDTVTD